MDDYTCKKFFEKFEKTDGCWIWKGNIGHGYGIISIGTPPNRKKWRAHRLSYIIHKGPIPDGLCVCHECDVRNCVNPDHLWLGTISDNIRDAINKGRLTTHTHKVDAKDVPGIRQRFHDGEDLGDLAKEFGVNRDNMARIVKGQLFKYCLGPIVFRLKPKMTNAKITPDQVREIRSLAGTMLQREIADRFGIKQVQVSRIILRHCWAHID